MESISWIKAELNYNFSNVSTRIENEINEINRGKERAQHPTTRGTNSKQKKKAPPPFVSNDAIFTDLRSNRRFLFTKQPHNELSDRVTRGPSLNNSVLHGKCTENRLIRGERRDFEARRTIQIGFSKVTFRNRAARDPRPPPADPRDREAWVCAGARVRTCVDFN